LAGNGGSGAGSLGYRTAVVTFHVSGWNLIIQEMARAEGQRAIFFKADYPSEKYLS
jgi:hypothetical protein